MSYRYKKSESESESGPEPQRLASSGSPSLPWAYKPAVRPRTKQTAIKKATPRVKQETALESSPYTSSRIKHEDDSTGSSTRSSPTHPSIEPISITHPRKHPTPPLHQTRTLALTSPRTRSHHNPKRPLHHPHPLPPHLFFLFLPNHLPLPPPPPLVGNPHPPIPFLHPKDGPRTRC